MQKKLLKSSLLVGAGLLVIAGIVYASSAKDFRIYLQANDMGCTTQLGTSRHTDFINKITGVGSAPWTTDSNGFDPDCYRVNLETSTVAPVGDITKDFRACLQFADNFSRDSAGNVTGVNQTGTQRCTPWASDGGGASDWSTDSNSYDPDGANLELETRALPTGTIINDARVGIQMSDMGCTAQFGSIEYTKWASEGGGWSNFAHDSNATDPDCGRVFLDTHISTGGVDMCEEPMVCANQKVLSLANTAGIAGEGKQYAVATRNADLGTPTPSIFNITNNLTYETWVFKTGNNRYGGILTVGAGFPDSTTGQVGDLRNNGWPSWYFYGDRDGNNSATDGRGLMFRVGRSNNASQCLGNCHEYSLGQDIPLGVWTHIALTVANGTTLTWYVNGVQAKTQALSGWDTSGTPYLDKVWLGVDPPGLPEFANAKFDEMRVWNVARTAAQIRQTMNTKLIGTESGLVNYWNFDDSALTPRDLTGHTGGVTGVLALKNGATASADSAMDPLKLCTRDTCGTIPPPATSTPSSTPPIPPPPATSTTSETTTTATTTPPTEASCSVFTASPTTLVRDIGHSTLTWSCTGGTGFPVVTDNNPHFSDLGSLGALSGNRDVSPRESTTFTLTYGTVVKTLKITVNDSNFGEVIP